MLKKALCIVILFLFAHQLKAQQYGLFNTKTLFDGFENPAQKTFTLDSSRKYASNFFLPYLGANVASKGNDDFIRKVINEQVYDSKNIPLGQKGFNTLYQNTNAYLLTFKVFNSYKYQKELGFSWQLRTDGLAKYTNETLVLVDNYQRLKNEMPKRGAFNDKGYAQTYHQFSVTYRENYTKRLAFGAKLSLLSGTSYNQLNISDSDLSLDQTNGRLSAKFVGNYRSTFKDIDELSTNTFMPTFKNPGASISLGTSYQSKSGYFLMANLKDLGFIRWNSQSYYKNVNEVIEIEGSTDNRDQFQNRLSDALLKNAERRGFYSATNAKLDAMLSKSFGLWTPSIIVSKNLFYAGGDAAMVNKFKYDGFSVSATPTYNFQKLFYLGLQTMYQTPNFEVFLGSDDVLKTTSQVKGILNKDATLGKSYNGASVYFGIGIKFGNYVEHPQNSSTMPGIGEQPQSVFQRIFSIFSKKK
ncbi:DUF5723 family protein [Pedobacter gandavensis]|uniref:DUF5723 domain-containing protein n=1 Tax=Pedobacter gandavensis TaxID=2679963 RepID=A0ABR6F1B5_9SPHI|nr:DUF5723 family protein [Pedobacter gandavensis]MBB2151309.1 hypothetical protein [Pedobacter gandavensis]